jgi:hypothetical protein
MAENEFWIKFFWVFTVCFSVLAFSISGCTIHQNQAKKSLIALGKDPISVMCAYEDMTTSGRAAICSIKASK